MRYTVFYMDVSPALYDTTQTYAKLHLDLLASDANHAAAQFKDLYPNKRIYTIMPSNDLLNYKQHNCYSMVNMVECRVCGKILDRPSTWFETMEKIGWIEGVASDDLF